MAAWCQLRKKLPSQLVLYWLVYDPIVSNQIFIVPCCSLLRPFLPALWWINIPWSESSFTNLVQTLKFSINTTAGEDNSVLGNFDNQGILRPMTVMWAKTLVKWWNFPNPSWSQLVTTSDVQLTTALQSIISAWCWKPPSFQLTPTGF